jgi:heme/copper-type cytochrome/quinol oxidase subunit 2
MKKIFILLFILAFQLTNAQCAMCKAVVESGNISEAEGLNTGILYLMIFPYILVGALLYFIIKYRRKHKI